MEAIFANVLNILLPVLLCVLVGFALARFKVVFDTKMVGGLVSNVGYPALVLSHMAAEHVSLSSFFLLLVAAALVVVCFAAMGVAVLKLLGWPVRAYLPPVMLSNVGNIGLPVATLAFGAMGTTVAVAFVVVVLTAIFTAGIAIAMGKADLGKLARQPVVYAVGLALALMATGTAIPAPVDQALKILGGLAIPLMLLTLGYTLANLRPGKLVRGVSLSVIHVVMSGVIAFGVLQFFPLDPPVKHAAMLLCFMPPSVATYLWVETYRPDDAPEVAGFILISTLLVLLTVPAVLTVLGA